MGGQQVIKGAHVYMFAANTTGYGGAGIAASINNKSQPLLSSSGPGTTKDTSGGPTDGDYYVTSDSTGLFTLTGAYSCTAGQQVYLYALGGDAGAGANSAAGLLEVLGNCPGGTSAFLAADPNIVINEVTTIAAAYAFAGFATDPTHVSSSGTPLALTGIANAFANAGNLANIVTGNALMATAAGNGSVPQSEIYTLANILGACVNSSGPGSSACSTLLADELSGGATGTAPTDTATAAINMAHNPGGNITPLYALSNSTPPFAPALTSKPYDFTVSITYTGGGMSSPNGIAIDGSGNAWITNYTANTVTELSNLGAVLSPTGGYSGGGLLQPIAIAIDNSGNAWIADEPNSTTTGEVTKISGGTVTGYTGGGLMGPYGIAIDGANNVWVPNGDNSTVSKFSNSGTPLSGTSGFFAKSTSGSAGLAVDGGGNVWVANHSTVSRLSNSGVNLAGGDGYSGGGLDSTDGMIAVDGSGNAWMSSGFGGAIIEISHAGSFVSGSSGYTGGGMSLPICVAIDGAGNAWVTNYTGTFPSLTGITLVELSNSGSVLSGASGYLNAPLVAFEQNAVNPTALDGSGNIWLANNGTNNSVTEVIGAAVPVITPISAGLPSTFASNGTSSLGTRP
jgi:hypothetical protein